MPAQPFDTKISLSGVNLATLDGSITGLTVIEADDTGQFTVDTNNIMRTDRDWQITLKWRLFGSLLDMTPPNMGIVTAELHGKFKVMAYFEGIGAAADEKDLEGDKTKLGGIDLMNGKTSVALTGSRTPADSTATPPVPNDPEATEWQYVETFTIRGQTAKADPQYLKPGAYRLSVNLTYEQPDIDPITKLQNTDPVTGNLLFKPGPMAGFMELPDMIQVYDPGTF